MGWWDRLRRPLRRDAEPRSRPTIPLELPGWTEESPDPQALRAWRHEDGAVLVLTHGFLLDPDLAAFRDLARSLAAGSRGGLLEADRVEADAGACSTLIYKKLNVPAYHFTGMTFVEYSGRRFLWTMVDGERGTTGVREATVTAELMKAGELTLETYTSAWHDPYDPGFSGVDRSCMRFVSDDARYDERFPGHPLTRIREVQRWLRSSHNARSIALESIGGPPFGR
jgi:hypothetical protein